MAARMNGLNPEHIRASDTTSVSSTFADNASTIRTSRSSKARSFIKSAQQAMGFTFDRDLQESRVYRRALPGDGPSRTSLASSALYTTAMSLFSQLSLSQVSHISFYALPIYCSDLSNSWLYVFGDEGMPTAVQPPADQMDSAGKGVSGPKRIWSPGRLIGRYATRQKRPHLPPDPSPDPVPDPNITDPRSFNHHVHIRYDKATKTYIVGIF